MTDEDGDGDGDGHRRPRKQGLQSKVSLDRVRPSASSQLTDGLAMDRWMDGWMTIAICGKEGLCVDDDNPEGRMNKRRVGRARVVK